MGDEVSRKPGLEAGRTPNPHRDINTNGPSPVEQFAANQGGPRPGGNPVPSDQQPAVPAGTQPGDKGRPLGQDALDSRFGQPEGERRPLVNEVLSGRPESTRAANNLATEHMHMSTPTGVAKPVTVELRDGGGTQNMTRIKAEDGRTVLYSRPDQQGGEQFFRQEGNRLVQTDRQGQKVQNGESLNVRNIQVGRSFEAPAPPATPRPGQPAVPTDQPTKRPANPPPVDNPHRTVPTVDRVPGPKPAVPTDQPAVAPPGGPRRGEGPATPPGMQPRPGDRPPGPGDPPNPRGRGNDGPAGPGGPNPHRTVPPGEGRPVDTNPGGRGPQDNNPGRGPNRGPEGPVQPGGSGGPPRRRDVQDQPSLPGDRGPRDRGPGDRGPVVPVPVPGRDGGGPGGGGGPAGRDGGERGGKPVPGERPDIVGRGGDRGIGGGGRPDLLDRVLDGKPGAKPLDPRVLEIIGDPKLQQKMMDIFQRALGDRDSLSPRIKEIFRDLDDKQLVQLQRGLLDGLKNPLTMDRLDPLLQGKLRDLSEALGGKELATGRLIDGMIRDGMLVPGRDTLTTVIRDMDRTSKLFESSDKSSRELLSEMLARGLDKNQFLIGTEAGGTKSFTMRLDADDASMRALVDRLQANVLKADSNVATRGLNPTEFTARALQEDDSPQALSRMMDDGGDDGATSTKVEEIVKAIVAKEVAVSLAKPGDPPPAPATRPAETAGNRLPDGPLTVNDGGETASATSLPADRLTQNPYTPDDGPAENKPREEKKPEDRKENTGPTPEEIAALAQRKLDEERKRREREEEARRLDQERKEKEKKNKRGTYRVRHGDSLLSIAQSQCSDGNLAPLIYDINRGRIGEKFVGVRRCAVLKVGQNLTLPSENDITNFKRWGGRSSGLDFSHQAGSPDVLIAPEGGYGSAEAELAAKFGMAWGGASGTGKSRFDDGKEVKGRRTDHVKAKIKQNRHHIEAALGPLRKDPAPQENRIKYVCRIGDTLRSVALRHASLQDVKLWELIAIINGISTELTAKGEPAVKLSRGQTLLLPVPAEIQAWRSGTFQKEATFVVLNEGCYVELASRECPHCGRPTLLTAVICPGCASDMDAEADVEETEEDQDAYEEDEDEPTEQENSKEVAASEPGVGGVDAALTELPRGYDTRYDIEALPSSVESAADSEDAGTLLPRGYDTAYDLNAMPVDSYSDQMATSDDLQSFYEFASRSQSQGTESFSDMDMDAQLAFEQSATADQLSSIPQPLLDSELDGAETVDIDSSIVSLNYEDEVHDEVDEQTGTAVLKLPADVLDRKAQDAIVEPLPPPLPAYARTKAVETGAPLSPVKEDHREPHYLSVNARLMVNGSPDDLNAGYKIGLEGLYDMDWISVACYEFYEDVILHHTADQFGKKKTRRIALPVRQALQLAENDLTTNWFQYMRAYSTGI